MVNKCGIFKNVVVLTILVVQPLFSDLTFMLLYHPYYFSFMCGSSLIVSMSGVFLNIICIWLFEITIVEIFMILIDVVMITIAILDISVIFDSLLWVFVSILFSIYVMVYSLYVFFRNFKTLAFKNKVLGVVGNILVFTAYILFTLSARGVLPNKVGTSAMLFMIVFPFLVFAMFSINIVRRVQNNPMHKTNERQSQLAIIFKNTLAISFIIGIPSATLMLSGAYFEIPIYLELGITLLPFITLSFSASNFCIQLNKSLENRIHIGGSELFSVKSFLSLRALH